MGDSGSGATTPGEPLLAALRGGDAAARDRAFRRLLAEHGVSFDAGERGHAPLPAGGPVNQQPGSVIQQAATDLWEDLRAILDRCATDEDLRRVFATVIKRRRIDRFRRFDNRGKSLDACIISPPIKPATGGMSPETRMGNSAQYQQHVSRLLEAAAGGSEDPEDGPGRARRELVEMYVVRRMEWGDIAAALNENAGTLRVRFTRLRPRLVEAVYRPFLRTLGPDLEAIGSVLLVDGRSSKTAAEQTGTTIERVRAVTAAEIVPRMRDYFGVGFLELLPRLQRHAD